MRGNPRGAEAPLLIASGLDHDHLWLEVAPDVSAAGLDLVAATEYGPSQAAAECVFVVAVVMATDCNIFARFCRAR